MFEVVLDASAVLALVRGEPGGEIVGRHVAAALVCAVNHAEVVGRLRSLDEAAPLVALRLHNPTVAPFDADLAVATGNLAPATRHLGLSLGDRACLALALREGLPVLTADRAWADLEIGVEVRLIR